MDDVVSLRQSSEICALATPGSNNSVISDDSPRTQKLAAEIGAIWFAGRRNVALTVSASEISARLNRMDVSATLTVMASAVAPSTQPITATTPMSSDGRAVCC